MANPNIYEPFVPYDKQYNKISNINLGVYKPYTPGSIMDFSKTLYPYSEPKTNYFSNYNDPNEINSMADAILTTFNPNMNRTKFLGIEQIPLLNIIPATLGDLFYDKTVKPLINKQYGAVGINTLINLGETLDVVANPVKAKILGGSVTDAMGWGDKGRVNYDYNTGNFIKDVGAEILSDPLNWATLGIKAIASGVVKGALKGALKEAAQEAGESLINKVGREASEKMYKQLSKEAIRSYLAGDIDGMTRRMMHIASSMTEKGLLKFEKLPVPQDFIQAMDKLAIAAQDHMSTTVLKATQSIVKPVESFERTLFKSAFASSGITPVWWAMKQGGSWATQFLTERSTSALKKYERPDGNISFTDYEESLNDFTQNIEDLKMTNKLSDDPNMTPEMHTLFMRQSVQADEVKFNQLFKEFNDEPIQFEKELLEYLKTNRNVDSIEEYIAYIQQINSKTNGAFYAEQQMFESQLDRIQTMKDYGKWKEADAALTKSKTIFTGMTDELKGIFTKKVTQYNLDVDTVPTDHFEDHVIKAVDAKNSLDFGNFQDFMETVVKRISKSDGYDASSVYGDLTRAYTYFVRTNVEPYFEKWDNRLLQNNPELMPTWFRIQDIIWQWQTDVEKQISVYQTKISKTGDLYNPKGKTWFNFNKKHTADQLEAIITDHENMHRKMQEMHRRLDDYNSVVYKSIDSFLGKAAKAKGIVDQITNSTKAQLIKENKQIPLLATDILKIDYEIKELFENDIRGWLEQNHAVLRNVQLAPEAFIEKFEAFLSVDFTKDTMEEYASRYEDLQKYLNNIISQNFNINKELLVLEKKLESLNPYVITHKNLMVKADETFIQFKLEQLYTNFFLLENKDLNEFIDTLNTNSGLGEAINNYANSGLGDISKLAEDILSAAENYNHYYNFIEKLYQYPMQDKTRFIFLSTLQKYATQDPRSFYDNIHIISEKIFKDMNSYMYATEMKEALNLDELSKVLDIDIKLSLKYGTAEPHTANWDVLRTEEIIKEKLSKEFDDASTNYIIADIETTGLNKNRDQLLEIAFKQYGTEDVPVSLRRGLNPEIDRLAIPQLSALNTFFPGLPEKEQIQKYFERFSNQAEHYDEKTILEEFTKRLSQLPPNTALVFHNGNEFDIDMLINRMKQHGVDTRLFKRIEKLDTLEMLKKKAGFEGVSKQDKNSITSLLENYADKMAGTDSVKLINPSNGDLAKSFIDLAKLLDSSATKEVKGFSVMNDPELFDKIYRFKQLGNSIYDQFQFIERSNRAFKTTLYEKSMLTGDEGLRIFTEEVMRTYGLTEQQVVEKFGNYLNPSKLLYALTEGANYVGYKNIINMNKIIEYFKFTPGVKVDTKLAKGLTSLAKQFDYAYNAIKNPYKLALVDTDGFDISKEIQRMLNELVSRTQLDANFAKNVAGFLSNIRTDKVDVISNWVLLQYMYKQYNKVNKLTPDLLQSFDKRLIGLLEDPLVLKSYTRSESEMSYIEASTKMRNMDGELTDLTINKNMVDIEAYREIVDEFQHSTVNTFKNLAQSLDEKSVYRPKTQAYAAALQKVQDLLEVYVEKLNEVPFFARKIELYKGSQEVTNRLAMEQTYNVLEMIARGDLKNFQSFFIRESKGILTIDMSDLLDYNNFKQVFAEVLTKTKELEALHIGMYTDKTRITLYLKNTANIDAQRIGKGFLSNEEADIVYTINGEIIEKSIIKELDLDTAFRAINDPEIEDALHRAHSAIHEVSETNITGALGDTTSKVFYRTLYNKLPEVIKKDMINTMKISTILKDEFFSETSFNFSNLGTVNSRRTYQEAFNSSIIDIYRKSAENVTKYAQTRIQYSQLYYDQSFSINNGWMSTVSNKDLIQALNNSPEFVLTALVQDPNRKHGYKVIQIKPTSDKLIEEARRLDAVIMPYQTFSKAFETINRNIIGQSALNLMHKIVYLYKIGYLLDPGVWMRNFIDSTMKTMVETQTTLGTLKANAEAVVLLKQHDNAWKEIVEHDQVVQFLRDMDPELKVESARYTAHKMLQEHDSVLDDILKMDIDGRITEDNIAFYFDYMNPKMDKDIFDFVHTYIFDGPSAGLTQELQKYFMDAPKGAWSSFVHLSNKLMTPNKVIEQSNRLAQYILLTERGITNTEAFHKIAKTHFDYAIKSDTDKMLEIVFPFYTFTMKNMEYWINAVNTYSWLPVLFRDIMTPIWNFDEIDHKELANNRSLQYQILAGNIPLNENGLTLKASPSFTDVFNLITNPVQNIPNKVFSPLQTIVGSGSGSGIFGTDLGDSDTGQSLLKGVIANSPIIGTMYQRYFETGPKYYERTGNPLTEIIPGILGGTLRYNVNKTPRAIAQFPKKTYIKRPRKARKSYARKSYARKTYMKNTWFNKYYPPKLNAARTYYPKHAYNMYRNYDANRGYDSIYKNLYSSTGQNRFKNRMMPVTSRTLKYKVKELWSYIK